jgi:hypothetical protein
VGDGEVPALPAVGALGVAGIHNRVSHIA